MTLALLATLLGIAVVDSINPSAIVMTTILLGMTKTARAPLVYVAGIALTYTAIGLVVIFGLGGLVREGLGGILAPSTPLYVIELVVGLGLLALAAVRLVRGESTGSVPRRREPRDLSTLGLLGLGAVITAVESTTALPYIGALGLVIAADASWLTSLVVLLSYNALFVAPPLALIALYARHSARFDALLARVQARLSGRKGTGHWVVALLVLASVILTSDAIVGLATGTGWI